MEARIYELSDYLVIKDKKIASLERENNSLENVIRYLGEGSDSAEQQMNQ